MRGGTLFSGIGAPECAMPWVDWRWAAEIDPFASAVHAVRFPGVRNLGDVNRIDADAIEPVDLVVFGSPCQSFSVAGKRLGLDDARGNMALVGLRLIGRIRPRWVVWENVPGVLSSDGGRDFGAFLGLLGELGYGFAYRVLDAQFAGVPQRRRRVFVVGYLGDWRPAAAVLFESESLRGDSPPRREAQQAVARCIATGTNSQRYDGESENFIAKSIPARSQLAHREDAYPTETSRCLQHKGLAASGNEAGTLIAHSLRADGFDASEDGTGRGTPLVTCIHADALSRDGKSINSTRDAGLGIIDDGTSYNLIAEKQHAVAFAQNSRDELREMPYSGALSAEPDMKQTAYVREAMSVRRLTPRECERLQGFEDDWTLVAYRGKPAADGPRYRAIGNSMAVPVVAWIGHRIQQYETATQPSSKGRAA